MVNTRSIRAGNSSQPLGRGQVPSNLPPHLPPPIPNTFPHVDHAEGGDENQPHNSAHNLASTANQDVVAAQLTTMQQQFGVFQLVLAQLLAQNNPGDPLINLLNPGPQPPAPQQNPEPVQRVPALNSLEKLVVEQRGAPPPRHAANSIPHPLNTNITLEHYPAGFRIPQLETYDRTKDPNDHLHAFYSCMQAQNASDALMCKIFPSTLRGNARTWYYSLPPRSISSYTEMASAFATKFSNRRFNDAVLEVSSFDQAMGITTVIPSISHERFRDSLLKHPTTTISKVNDRSLKFITTEEYALSQKPAPSKNQNPNWRDENLSKKWMRIAQNRGPMSTSALRFGRLNSTPPQQSEDKPPINWTPFNLPKSQIFMQIKNKMDLRRPSPMRTTTTSRDHTRYCDFHQDHGHTTEQCNNLRSELKSLAEKGLLNEYIQRTEQPRFVREQRPQPQGVRNPPNKQGVGYQQIPPPLPPPARIIHMITEGLEVGGLSSKQRKLYVREVKHQNRAKKRKFDDAKWKNQPITFTSTDLDTVVTPHNNPLVTFVMINSCEVQRVLVDTRSAPNIMYFHCFESLGLDPALLQKYDGPIYEFNNQPVPVEGVLTMNVAFGNNRNYVTPSVRFLFPTPMGIATLQGNQEVARHCYITSVTQPRKGKDQTPEVIPQKIPDNQQVMDMLGIPPSISQHKLSTNLLKKPVAQKRRLLRGERLQAIKEEVEKLLQPGFVKKVEYCEWVANPVLVKKANAALGNERLSLLDAYSGYHQVPMAPEDEEKTSFYAGDEIYCYVMMPFGLKNACATYQKMVTIVFRVQIGRNQEVYVDDIVVKSLKAEDHLADLDETFNNLRKNRMRLNPAKCIFGMESGKFLGFMVSRKGIETLYVDGASSSKGSGVGTLLIGLDGYRSKHALKFNFDATNNMAEYEDLLLGLQLALELKISAIQVYSDSQLVVNQINSICEVVDPVMVDSLSKFASNSSLSSRSVFVGVLDEPSFMKSRIMEISTDPDTQSWTNSIISFLRDGIVPEDRQEAMKLRKKASRYTLVDGVLYKRSFSLPLLRCLNPYEAEYALWEVHEGVCGSHVGPRTLAHKVLRQGYSWPNMYKDATRFVQKCPKCQFFAHLTHQPAKELTNLVAPWPFAQWGLDLLGPFVKGVGGVTHLIVGVDYFTKWVEARPLSNLTSKKVEDFVFNSIICRYGIPNQIVDDNGTQFNCSSFQDFCFSYGIKLQFTSIYHPESNGMVEYVNKCILEGIKPRLEQHKAKWADELNNVLWAYRTTSRTATVREEARLRTLVYKQKLANFYNKRVCPRTFKVGDLVLRKAGLTGFETHFGKLAPNWEGPYTVAEVPHHGAYVLQDAEGKRVPKVWNVNNLKKFYP
ncbi:hypothetical protein SLEP1_g4224 [Rubroshorea leprosula]|uniref:Integrase catalytic domain-containing protein n=1 Tax=Rubroshorea leprosula TaxID=152421 RepID=A0AAV5HVM5_9ROSI|nr:hypothetical protein SLEP1_g4224 [Rubroshorea leprosula]